MRRNALVSFSQNDHRRARRLALGLAALALAASGAACGADGGASDDLADGGEGLDAVAGDPLAIADGLAIAEIQCARCHAIGPTGDSPRADAPPLRTVLAGYAPAALADDFREGVRVNHTDMPQFHFSPLGVDALLAYLQTIQVEAADE